MYGILMFQIRIVKQKIHRKSQFHENFGKTL